MGYDMIPVAWTVIAGVLLLVVTRGSHSTYSGFKLPLILRDISVSSLKVNIKEASTI